MFGSKQNYFTQGSPSCDLKERCERDIETLDIVCSLRTTERLCATLRDPTADR